MQSNFYNFVKSKAEEYFTSLGFDEEIVSVLQEQAVLDLQENLDKFKQWIESEQNDLEELATLAHTIKGVLVNMGLDDLGAKFKNIQNLIVDNVDKETLLTAASSLVTELDTF
jgi:HPt (histidine-containing phosphotransfer) domain-containing protein